MDQKLPNPLKSFEVTAAIQTHLSISAFWHLLTIKMQVSTSSLLELDMISFQWAKVKRASEW